MDEVLHVEQIGYAVVLQRPENGAEFLAPNDQSMPAVFRFKNQVVAFRDELYNHHNVGKGRVVKVRLLVEVVE